ncbi:hypothetical protein LO771_26620 [Streptacidiphilus sp. ASG 303]|nr:hypothetical protein [Streptacidiphilus sp. ASG 303]
MRDAAVHPPGRTSRPQAGNRYDGHMRSVDVSTKDPGTRLVARLHIDLCRLASGACRPHAG